MRNLVTTAIVGCLASTTAMAGGLDRSRQPITALFEEGRHIELSFASVAPDVSGEDQTIEGGGTLFPVANNETGNVAENYSQLGFAYKADYNEQFSYALIFDQPFGAAVDYGSGSALYGGTSASVSSAGITVLGQFNLDGGFSLYGGLRRVRIGAEVTLSGQAYGGVDAYEYEGDDTWATGYVVGIAYERPDIAARVSLTYSSEIDFELDATEAGALAAIGGGDTKTDVTTPQSINLEFQTGVAPDTLLFGSVRWTNWDGFEVAPTALGSTTEFATGTASTLVSYDKDIFTYSLGLGRRFTDEWSGAVIFAYEKDEDDFVSALGPTDGFKSLGVAATYKLNEKSEVTGGLRYILPGDAETDSGAGVAKFTDGSALALGLKLEMKL